MKAKYFCGNCSRQVSPGATVCPYCGSSFTAVRCPSCGYEGKAAEFGRGCPVCGFMMEDDVRVPAAAPAGGRPEKPPARKGMSRLFYRVAGIVLIVLLVALVVLLLLKP